MVNHDNKGKFVPGNKASVKANRKNDHYDGVGHPKTIKGKVKDALKLAEDAMPEIIAKMIITAKGEDDSPANVQQQAREYLIDRIYGKANQPISTTTPWEIIVTYGKPVEDQPIEIEGGIEGKPDDNS